MGVEIKLVRKPQKHRAIVIDSLLNSIEYEIKDECKPKVGRWILEYLVSTNGDPYAVYRCNLCEWAEPTLLRRNYCPNCGAKMEENR